MESAPAFEILLLLCIAPALIGWLAGELHGAWRTRRTIGPHDPVIRNLTQIMYPAPPMERQRTRAAFAPMTPPARRTAAVSKPLADPDRLTLRELCEYTDPDFDQLPSTLSPSAAQAIEEYQYSIAALRQLDRSRRRAPAQPDFHFDQLPQIAGAAPLSPDFLPDELIVHTVLSEAEA